MKSAGGWDLTASWEVSRFNCYVEPVYTLDADFVLIAARMEDLKQELVQMGFSVDEFQHSLNARAPESELRIQFTSDARYQSFLDRAHEKEVLGVRVRVARLEDLVQSKLWAFLDPERRLTNCGASALATRKKDDLDLLRLAEAYPYLRDLYAPELRTQLEG